MGAVLGLVASLVAIGVYDAMIGTIGAGTVLITIDWTWVIIGSTGIGAMIGLGYSASRRQ
ncbi:MAG TPA: hypothetical protein VK436_15345 [Methanocella sp.]|nr:hypothetical protein [Methanocella sp.]